MSIKVYYHQKCTTCKKALKFLDDNKFDYQGVVITEEAPTLNELKKALECLKELRKLFNTSGMEYRSRQLKDKIPNMSEDEAFELLNDNGMLVKRPFLVAPKGVLVGFKQPEWEKFFCYNKLISKISTVISAFLSVFLTFISSLLAILLILL